MGKDRKTGQRFEIVREMNSETVYILDSFHDVIIATVYGMALGILICDTLNMIVSIDDFLVYLK